jgi:hypothetical protein
VHDRFKFLRSVGVCYRDPSKTAIFHRPDYGRDSTLVKAYCLYLSAIEFRSHAAQTSGELYTNAHSSIGEALREANIMCRMIEPHELSVVLQKAVDDELVLVHNGDIFR